VLVAIAHACPRVTGSTLGGSPSGLPDVRGRLTVAQAVHRGLAVLRSAV
jgi:hypothetical protein